MRNILKMYLQTCKMIRSKLSGAATVPDFPESIMDALSWPKKRPNMLLIQAKTE